jgi:hypothetical protein
MNKLSDSEKLMYTVIGALANSDVPVIYKGALITKLILQENRFEDFTRETQDIDASWAGVNPPTMEQLATMLNRAISPLGLHAMAKREYGDLISAGFKIADSTGEIKLLIDIDMRPAVDSRAYQYGNAAFRGVTPDSVIADKISVASSDKIFRRSKDLTDLYALAHCVTVKTADIYRILERESRVIGTFDAFKNRHGDLRHAYEKLRRVDAKPEFDVIFSYLTQFLTPFIEAKTAALIWDNGKSNWSSGEPLSQREPQTLLEELAGAKRVSDATGQKIPRSF